jgi:hypothetical protein
MAFKSLNGLSSMGPVSVTISTPDKTEMLSKLFHARDVIHLAHLKTTSYAAHKALNKAYEYLLDFADDLTEMEQGKAGTTFDLTIPSASYEEPVSFLKDLNMYLTSVKGMYCDATINKIEELQGNINQTLYLLSLK